MASATVNAMEVNTTKISLTSSRIGPRREILAIGAILTLSVSLQLIFLTGITVFDSTAYAHKYLAIARGTYHYHDPDIYTQRTLLAYPTALSFRLFGVSELSAAAYPMLCSIGTLVLVYVIGRQLFGKAVGLWASLLLATCPIYILTACEVAPDVPATLYMTLSVGLFLAGHYSPSKWRCLWFALAGLAMGAAYLVKEPDAILLLAFYVSFFLVYRRDIGKSHWLVFAIAAMVFLAETIIFWSITGDLLWRLHSAVPSPTRKLNESDVDRFRIWWYWWQMFVKINGFGFLFYLLLGGLLYAVARKKRELILPAIWFFSIYLYLQFGPWNLHWVRAPANARYLMPALVPACLIISYWLINGVWTQYRRLFYSTIIAGSMVTFLFTCVSYARAIELRNGAKWAWQWLEQREPLPVYSGVHPCRAMMFYSADSPKRAALITPYFDYNNGSKVDLSSVSQCYVVIDQLTTETIDRDGGPAPKEVRTPPANWHLVADEQVAPPLLAAFPMKMVHEAICGLGNARQWFGRLIPDVEASAYGGRVKIYYVPSRHNSEQP